MIPTSNHNFICLTCRADAVVYLLIPTSNHNIPNWEENVHSLYIFWFLHQTTTLIVTNDTMTMLYIFWFLHQTTTLGVSLLSYSCCISFDSYIKPQLNPNKPPLEYGCISFDSYIKPQLLQSWVTLNLVVYLLIPTSNHNCATCFLPKLLLYIFWFLHQTTTVSSTVPSLPKLYIFWFLHQTTTSLQPPFFARWLYIFWFLHQTTTPHGYRALFTSCISFDSYIKPQP